MTKLLLKKSSVVGKIPLVGDLEYGELALNYADGKLYYKTSSNTIEAFNDSASTHTLINAFVDSDYVLTKAGVPTGITLGAANELLIVGSDGTSIVSDGTLNIDPSNNYVGINQTSPQVTLHMTGEGAQTAQVRMEQYNSSADAPDLRTRRYRGTIASPSAIQSGDYLYRSNHEYWNGSALIVGGTFAFDNTNDANRTQFAVSVTTDGTSADANTPSKVQFKIDGNDNGAITFNNAYKFPTSDGTANQFLQTDGNGNITFADVADAGIDSAAVTAIIDSDYINARVGEVGIDSAAVIAIIDSDYVQSIVAAPIGTANMVVLNTFSGDSSTTAFTLTKAPTTEQHAIVTVNGVLQQVDDYSLSGTTLTFGTAPVTGDDIEVRTLRFQNGTVELRDYKQYVFQPSALTTSFSGSDINGDVLAYDEGKVEVYLNGAQLVKDLDFTANNDTTVTLLGTGADSGDTLTVTSLAKASFLEGEIDSAQAALTSTATNQVVDTMSTVNHRTAKYIVQMTQNSRYHSQEVLLVHDGTTVHMTTYAEIYTESDLGSVDADISGGNVRLLVSPNYANTDIRTKRIDLGV
jgi:hypothetical protein